MFCRNCGLEISDRAVSCPKCGEPCKLEVTIDISHANPNIPKKEMWIAYLIWFFAGGFGGHRFYLERQGSAIAILLLTVGGILTFGITTIASMIWCLVDAALIPSMIDEINQTSVQYIEER